MMTRWILAGLLLGSVGCDTVLDVTESIPDAGSELQGRASARPLPAVAKAPPSDLPVHPSAQLMKKGADAAEKEVYTRKEYGERTEAWPPIKPPQDGFSKGEGFRLERERGPAAEDLPLAVAGAEVAGGRLVQARDMH